MARFYYDDNEEETPRSRAYRLYEQYQGEAHAARKANKPEHEVRALEDKASAEWATWRSWVRADSEAAMAGCFD